MIAIDWFDAPIVPVCIVIIALLLAGVLFTRGVTMTEAEIQQEQEAASVLREAIDDLKQNIKTEFSNDVSKVARWFKRKK